MIYHFESSILRFFHGLDERRYDSILGLLAPDMAWLRQGVWHEGHDAILSELSQRPAGMYTRHVVTNVVRMGPEDMRRTGATADPFERERVRRGRKTHTADDVKISHYMTAYRFDGVADSAPPWVVSGPHKLSVVRTLFKPQRDAWLMAEMLMLPQFVFEQAHA